MKSKFFFTVMALLMVLCSVSSAQVPQLINYQGKLTKSTGTPVDTTISMVFTIYADSSGTISKWSETQTAVKVEKGVFNVLLGNVNPIPDSVFDGSTRYLGVKVGADPEITPRKPMVSVAYAYRAGVGGEYWTFRITDTADTTLIAKGPWGIARYGNVLYGSRDSTHVNLGVACTTGTNGQNQKYCTVGGGLVNAASGGFATVGGGDANTASSWDATVGGGEHNTVSGDHATLGGGYYNTASGPYSFVGGGVGNISSDSFSFVGCGERNTASAPFATVPGGYADTAAGNYSFAAGDRVRITSAGDYTFALGSNFTTSASHAVIFHDSGTPIKVGIGTTSPQGALDVSSTTGALIVPRMTTTQRNALTAVNGMIIYNTTTNQFNFYENGAWVTK
jgi:hypothetical protein